MSVGDGFAFDGGINEDREAAYPFYRLNFGSYSMVITTKDQLLLQLDRNISYDYGIGREGAPIRFVTPNIEFIEVLRDLLPMAPNIDEGKFDYLMNAIGLTIDDQVMTIDSVFVEEQAQINKVARSLRNAAGKELSDEEVDQEAAVFDFIFADGRTIRITYTDQYIEFNGQYYKALKSRSDFMASLFAAYF